jgi:hypothetical protein
MSDLEYKSRVRDAVGETYSVRLRFQSPMDHGVYIYAPNASFPLGYSLERNGSVVRWIIGAGGGDDSKSPGLEHLEGMAGKGWLFVPRGGAIEWDIESFPTKSGFEEARSVFVKRSSDGEALELLSSWFKTSDSVSVK